MQISICDLNGKRWIVELENVSAVNKADDVIYFNGEPYQLSTAQNVEYRWHEED